ncbi:P43 5S RNA-binding protein isoform X2 [Cryptotermes secundus]|uniref:P43 5S RNA-binding protein isoform X2 n=1 Tax=Cryptotermes secundus TaxID=105785 RepID=UPI001454CBED|nr:P43 5S RNA-binding protein isoform X2 [Cryptotermes secundus]
MNNLSTNIHTFTLCLQENLCKKPGCGKIFTNRKYLMNHMRRRDGLKLSECNLPQCKIGFKHLHFLKEMSLDFKCQDPGCRQVFKMPSQLRAHIRWHKRHEAHVCSWPGCKLRFTTNGILEKHMKTHNREKPFSVKVLLREFHHTVPMVQEYLEFQESSNR